MTELKMGKSYELAIELEWNMIDSDFICVFVFLLHTQCPLSYFPLKVTYLRFDLSQNAPFLVKKEL